MKNWQITLTLFLVGYFASAFGVAFGSFGSGMAMATATVFELGIMVPSLMADGKSLSIRLEG